MWLSDDVIRVHILEININNIAKKSPLLAIRLRVCIMDKAEAESRPVCVVYDISNNEIY